MMINLLKYIIHCNNVFFFSVDLAFFLIERYCLRGTFNFFFKIPGTNYVEKTTYYILCRRQHLVKTTFVYYFEITTYYEYLVKTINNLVKLLMIAIPLIIKFKCV